MLFGAIPKKDPMRKHVRAILTAEYSKVRTFTRSGELSGRKYKKASSQRHELQASLVSEEVLAATPKKRKQIQKDEAIVEGSPMSRRATRVENYCVKIDKLEKLALTVHSKLADMKAKRDALLAKS